jgi:cyclopropane-fatty-acyl-phospholipid synthase
MPPSEVNHIAEQAGIALRDVEHVREHSALTLRHWDKRLEARQAEANNRAGEATSRTWRLYMAASAYNFESGVLNVNQTLLAKPADGQSNVPLSRADLIRRTDPKRKSG